MAEAYIVAAVRTAGGKRNGKLSGWHPVDLAASVLDELIARTGCDPALVEDVIMGCVGQAGEQAVNIARNAVMASCLPESVPATSVDRQCGSSQQAAHFAAQGVISGAYDIVIAAGVEVMTRVPMGSSMVDGKYGFPFGPRLAARYESVGGLVPQGISAELIAEKWGITREEMDRFGLQSQQRAARATAEGRFQAEILPVLDAEGRLMTTDEGIRDSSYEKISSLKPSFIETEKGGKVTAGNSSQITDGSAALLIMSEEKAKASGYKPRSFLRNYVYVSQDPKDQLLLGPAYAIAKLLKQTGLTLADIDVFELHEAFAGQVVCVAVCRTALYLL